MSNVDDLILSNLMEITRTDTQYYSRHISMSSDIISALSLSRACGQT